MGPRAEGFAPQRWRTEQIRVERPAEIRINQHNRSLGSGPRSLWAADGEARPVVSAVTSGGTSALADAARLVRIGIIWDSPTGELPDFACCNAKADSETPVAMQWQVRPTA